MRRTVATLLVVATSLLMAVPVGASEARPTARPAALPAAPAVVETPVAPAPDLAVVPPVTAVQPPVLHAPAVAAPAAPAVTRPAAKVLRAKVPSPAALTDAAYSARLQAELCRARQIFCGLDNGGRYPAR